MKVFSQFLLIVCLGAASIVASAEGGDVSQSIELPRCLSSCEKKVDKLTKPKLQKLDQS